MKIVIQKSKLIFELYNKMNTIIFIIILFVIGLVLFLPEGNNPKELLLSFKTKLSLMRILTLIAIYSGLIFMGLYLKEISTCVFDKKARALIIEYRNLLGQKSYQKIDYHDIYGIKFEENYNYDTINKYDLIINTYKDISIYHGRSKEEMQKLVQVITLFLNN